ncbi:MAG: hypothetical protein HYX59_09985 [Elusimicrobia bacterium]|nr:hypothetical protein [Elusimicrobiota bacterium]
MSRILCLAAALAAGLGTARAGGFLVFDGTVTNWAPDAQGGLAVAGTRRSGDIDDFFAAHGRVYHLEKLLGRAVELKPDLTPLREAAVKSATSVPEWVGAWDKGVLVFCDNAVVYLDEELKEAGRTALEPRKSGDVTPVLRPAGFAAFAGSGYLLVSTNQVFVLPLGKPGKGPLRPEVTVGYEQGLVGLWLDPKDRTLNLLAATHEEKPPRVVKQQRVLSYGLYELGKAPRSAVVHEVVEVHEPRRVGPQDEDDAHRRGGIIEERMPPYRTETSSGTYIGIRSRTTPAYAETFDEGGPGLRPRSISRLRTLGVLETAEVYRDGEGGPLWLMEGERRLYLEPDLTEHVLRLQPAGYAELATRPGLRPHYFKALAY